MYKRSLDDEIIGVLNDFDLAIISGRRSSNTERTGTMPFMALDVLESITASSPQQHLYRYDVESFLWVAIWVCGTFEHGKERENPPFKDWTQGDANHCRAKKLVFLDDKDSPWSGDHKAEARILLEPYPAIQSFCQALPGTFFINVHYSIASYMCISTGSDRTFKCS
jgi:Fungal protein kinase